MNTKPVTKTIAKSGTALLLSQLLLNVVNIFTTIYLARVLSKPEFAILAVLEIFISIFQFSELSFVGVASQQAPSLLIAEERKAEGLALVKAVVVYRTIIVLLMGAITIAFAPFFADLFLKDVNQAWAIRLLTPAAIGTIFLYSLQSIAQVINNFYLIATWNFISGVLRAILSILFFVFFGYRALLVGIILSILISVIGMAWSLRAMVFNPVPPADFLKTLRYGFPLFIRTFFRFGFTQYDQLLVATLLTPFDLASYNIARRFAKLIAMLIDSFQRPVTIRLASLRHDSDAVQSAFFRKATRYTTLIFLSLAAFIAAGSPWIMWVYGGEKYTSNWPLLAILAITQGIYSLYNVFSGTVFARLQPTSIMLADGITGGANFILAPVLISLLGKNGVAWGQMLGFSLGILLTQSMLRQSSGFRLDWGSLGRIAVPLLVSCGLVVAGQMIYPHPWIVPLYLAVGGVVYFLWIGKRLTSEDWAMLRGLLPSAVLLIYSKIQTHFHK